MEEMNIVFVLRIIVILQVGALRRLLTNLNYPAEIEKGE